MTSGVNIEYMLTHTIQGHNDHGAGHRQGSPQCYQCSTIGHIATNHPETYGDAQCVLQEAKRSRSL